ncbi:putative bifunctional diguanylate cyclase/phosphodiesterase [Pseudomonas sp. 5P_3.1_Bac2]|uniref:putative bifunctional diguanylate cyclase/phosphodiesterase n=1 Tax=Pseudomonas sp. 5P_3.1_Bac2 TaxID=2971617 RepID=UPI0021C77CB2|nr:bifunctional diguanylate cyclase/phosphodiesterase [Pseudomonas sp. 5P_3.1_Bac2]MCU1716450.1 EAL domain-containing protein [Pseudomonas sp. 5P_3.1_Bac2]
MMDGLGIRFMADMPATQQVILVCNHETWLVVLSYLIAALGSFIALTIASHCANTLRLGMRLSWQLIGGLCLAGGIWSMHFIGMLAFQTPIAVSYDLSITLFSLLVALLAGLIAVLVMTESEPSLLQQILAAIVVGLGICAMHYSGMAALRADAQIYYDARLFSLSIGIAIGASFAALKLAQYIHSAAQRKKRWLKYAAALVMGAAIAAMHYTGMAALNLVSSAPTHLALRSADNSLHLLIIVAGITLLVLGLSLTAAWAGRKLDEKDRDLQRVNALLVQLDQDKDSLELIAHYDPLTEQLNRRGFNHAFSAALAEHSSNGRGLAVMFLDVDHFKRINDSLGHDAGDELLSIMAKRIRSAMRESDIVARLGGDEFCVIASLENNAVAQTLAQRLLQRMKEPIKIAGRNMLMTTSIGISVFPQDGDTVEELIKHADLALYQAKNAGRNTLHFYSRSLTQKASQELQLEEDLRQAITKGEQLQLYYQPIIDLPSGQMVKLEALLRWQHPQLGLLSPERFIGIAEANGFIDQLDAWVLHQAASDLQRLTEQGYGTLKITVNCSAMNFASNQLPERIEQVLSQAQSNQRLELELTESALLTSLDKAINKLQRIRALGVSIAIDDFGTGYSSLACLRRLPLDTLKIDRSFIQDIASSVQSREIVQAIIVMARALNLRVVAEGVEDLAQLQVLQEQGCDQVQGYLFSKPRPLSHICADYPPHCAVLERVCAQA